MGLYPNVNLGIGAACAIALAQAGAAVCLVLRESKDDTPPNLATVDAIRSLGATARFVHCDLDNLDSVKGVFQKALDAMGGRIDVLVNCAGIQRRSPSLDFSETDWDDVRFPLFPLHICPLRFSLWYNSVFLMHALLSPAHSLIVISISPYSCFTGFRRQSQVRLAPFAGCWSPHGPKAPWKDHKLLFPPHFPRRYHCSRIRSCQRRLRTAHESLKQRMEPAQRSG